MDDGLIQVIVIALFVIIALMEGVSRKKRQGAAPRQSRSEEQLWEAVGDLSGGGGTEADTSEGLVPDETWEEIAALARSEPTTPPERISPPQAEPLPRLPERTDDGGGLDRVALPISSVEEHGAVAKAEAREVAREATETAAFHDLHSSDLADLKKDEHFVVRSQRSAINRIFGKRGERIGELRRAVLLSEILGPPVSLRDPADR